MTLEQRITAIFAGHQPCIGYSNTGTTCDDLQFWTPGCSCEWVQGWPEREAHLADQVHAAHVATVLVPVVEEYGNERYDDGYMDGYNEGAYGEDI